MIPIFKPSYSEKELDAVKNTLKSCWWGAGPKTAEFEERFSEFIGTKYSIALNSCTAALHLAGSILNLKPKSEVITSPLTFISTAYLAEYNNLKIVFADIEEDTLNIDPEDIKKKVSESTRIILPVHYGGHACRMDEIMDIAKEKDLTVVEDCAHATGGSYKGKKLGSFGDMACFSFQAVKNLATGDGGMLTTDNPDYADAAKKLRWLGINKETGERNEKDQYSWEYEIGELGYKYQMCDLISSLGLAQLERVGELNKKRKEITKRYNEAFQKIGHIEIPVEKPYADSSNHNYVIKVRKIANGEQIHLRDKLMAHLKKKGISSGVHYKPLYLHSIYKDKVKAGCPVADRIWKQLLTLPLYPDMTEKEIMSVIDSVKEFKV